MAFYQYKQEQKVKASMQEVWDFISSPKNLKEITPDYMGFDITSTDIPEKNVSRYDYYLRSKASFRNKDSLDDGNYSGKRVRIFY